MSAYKIAFSKFAPEQKIPHGDDFWGTFNGSFNNLELEPVDILNQIYTGHPFTTWHSNHWRHSKNYMMGQHIALDFDTEDERSTIPCLMKDRFIQKHAFAIYTTPSHTPATPRARVLFLLDQPIQQAKNYVAAASSFVWLFGGSDRQCKDACRFFYGSHNCEIEWIGEELPLDKVKEIIGQYQKTGELAKRQQDRIIKASSADQQEVAEALKKIPAWGIEYDEWLKVLMAIHYAFGDSGLGMAESWADGKDNEVVRKWKSFSNQGNVSGAVTLNTVFKMARERGWQGMAA